MVAVMTVSMILSGIFLLLSPRPAISTETTGSSGLATKNTASPYHWGLGFDGKRAMELLEAQVKGGPRIPGNPGLEFTRNLIYSRLETNGFRVERQPFVAPSDLLGIDVEGINIIGLRPSPEGRIHTIFSCHYCTRPVADQDPDLNNRLLPVPGANDGASGVAVLLELASVIHDRPTTEGLALVFFDLEDHGAATNADGFAMGARHMAKNLPESLRGFQRGINIDMIGDRDLRIPMEGFGSRKARNLSRMVQSRGAEMYPAIFPREVGPPITDDHLPFLEVGHQYINLIDFTFKPWHTLADTPDKCSAASLEAVGRVLESLLRH
jgi:glutaminyl-peptide cyclotransferase